MKTFCITLPERPEEKERARKHFEERGMTVQFIDGINAEVFGLRTEHTYDFDNPGTDYHIGAKDVGLFLSHYAAWIACSTHDDDLFLILEADALLVENWKERLDSCLERAKKLGNFDIMYIGSCHCLDKHKSQLDDDLWNVMYPLCTHAYVVTKRGIEILLRTQRDCYASIDCALMQRSLPHMEVLTVLPRIADQVKWNDTSDHALKW